MSAKQSRFKTGLWQSTFVSIIGLLAIVFFASIVEKTIGSSLNQNVLTFVSLIIAFIPPVLWMTVFYRQDRLNPEPKSYVFKTLLLGALIQKAIYAPTLGFVFPGGLNSFLSRNYVATVILVAVFQETIKLLSVRYSIYSSREFDEKVDGIIYGSALGLGFAAMTSIDMILESGGAMLSNVTSLVVIETFAHASITGLSGYILGASKQSPFRLWRLPAAVLTASALNTVNQFLVNAVVRSGFEVNYKVGLIPVALLAVAVFMVLVVLSSREEKEGSVQVMRGALETKKELLGILPVWAILAVVLVTGFYVGHSYGKTTACVVENRIELTYPSDWIAVKGGDQVFKAGNMIKGGGREFVSVKKLPLSTMMSVETNSSEELLQNAAAAWSIKSGMSYRFYQAEKGYFRTIGSGEAYVIDYIYIENSGSGAGSAPQPSIGYARDIISVSGEDLYITTLSSSYEDYVLNKDVLSEIQYDFVSN